MTPSDAYLSKVRRAMVGMDPRVREDILRELRSHIADASAANGGDVRAALAQLGNPTEVGRKYREVYGYGRRFQALFLAIAFGLAVPSVPVLSGSEERLFPFTLSLAFLALVATWIVWVGSAAGSRIGLGAGVSAIVARLASFGAAAATQPAVLTAEGVSLFLVASAMLAVLGWLPGTARKAWTGPGGDL